MTIPSFEGVMTVIATPFGADGAIDLEVLGQHLDFVIERGVHWIIPGGTTGEYYAQTTEERRLIIEFTARHVGKRARLAVGANSARPAETVELTTYAKSLGYEAQMLAAPYYSLPDTHALADHYRHLARETGLPIILYNFPARTGVDMDRAFLEAVDDVVEVCAIKESSGSFARLLEQVVQFDSRFQRICGADDQAVDHFLWGARAWIAGASNFLPAEHVALYETCVVRQDYVAGQKLMRTMLPLFYLLENGGKYIQYVKYGCELAGLPVGNVRRPLLPLSDEEKASFRSLYNAVKSAGVDRRAA